MSQVRHIEIIEAQTDSEGNFVQYIDKEGDEEFEEFLFIDDDEYEFVSQNSNEFEQQDPENSLVCDICDRKFNNIEDRNAHIEDHFKSIECPGCERSFVGDRAFEFHISAGKCKRIVDNNCRFPCIVCNAKVFDATDKLAEHLLNEHQCTIAADQIACIPCDKRFSKLKYLKKHVREIHEKATIFNCEVCNKEFNRKANLIEHKLIHDGKYLAKCDECGNSYRTPSALKLHKRTHSGERPYRCDQNGCEKAYAYNTDLKRHKRSAHGIMGNPFPCERCSKVYYEPKLLKNHMKRSHKINDILKTSH